MDTTAYLAALRASGLIPEGRLAPLLAAFDGSSGEVLGQQLVARGLLTAAQHAQLRELATAAPSATEPTIVSPRQLGAGPAEPTMAVGGPDLEATHRVEAPSQAGPLAGFDRGELIGEGGAGLVHLAVDRELRREVAIKTLRHAFDPGVVRRFLNEARVTGQLEHPGIVPVHELGRDEHGRPFLVMKRLRGQSLGQLLAKPRDPQLRDLLEEAARPLLGRSVDADPLPSLALTRYLEIFGKICDAVAYAHARRLVHRDLKPDNVMIAEFGEVLVLDWGLARVVEDLEATSVVGGLHVDAVEMSDATQDGVVKGTPRYMSPEQARGDQERIGPATDVYALGALLYHILTGLAPVEEMSLTETILAVGEGEITPPRERAPGRRIPHELESIVLRAMAVEPDDRYRSVSALKDDIDAYLSGRSVGAARYTRAQLVGRLLRRQARNLVTAAAIVLVAVGGWQAARRSADSAERARLNSHLRQATERLRPLERDLERLAREALRQPQAALAESETLRGRLEQVAQALAADAIVSQHRPELLARGRTAAGRLDEVRLAAWQQRVTLACAEPPGAASDATARAAESLLTAADRAAREPGLAAIPRARLTHWLAQRAEARGQIEAARGWLVRGYVAQPRSRAAAAGLLLLARTSAAAGDHALAAQQLHRSLGAIGDHPRLIAATQLQLATALANLGAQARAPFAAELDARQLALRYLLQVVDPRGALRQPGLLPPAEARRASLMLEVLAQVSSAVRLPKDWQPLPADLALGRFVSFNGGDIQRWTLRPDTPGVTVLERGKTLPLGQLALPGGRRLVAPAGLRAARRGGKPTGELLLFGADEQQGAWLVTLDRERIPTSTLALPKLGPRSCGDFDGDGRVDLAMRVGPGQLLAWLRTEAGWRAPLRVTPEPPVQDSHLAQLLSVDLDADGRDELLVCRDLFQHLAVEAFAIGPGGARRRARRQLGKTRVGVWSASERPPRLLVCTANDLRTERALQLLGGGEPGPPLAALEMARGKDAFIAAELPLPTRQASLEGFHRVTPTLCALFAGAATEWRRLPVSEADPPLVIRRMRLQTRRGALFELVGERELAYRALASEELERLAALPLPAPRAPGSDRLANARMLQALRLPGRAADEAARELEQQPAPSAAERLELQRLVASGLAEARRWPDLARWLRALPPSTALAETVLSAAARLAGEGLRSAEAAALIGPWVSQLALSGDVRARLADGRKRWREQAALAERWRFDLRGQQLLIDGEPSALADHLLTSRLDMLEPLERVGWRVNIPEPTQRPAALAGASPFAGLAGIPLRLGGGSLRIAFELRVASAPWGMLAPLGCFAIDGPAVAANRAALTLAVRGGNAIDSILLRGDSVRLETTHLQGRWLRLEMTFDGPAQRLTLRLADPETRELLGVAAFDHTPAPSGHVILGFHQASTRGGGQFELRRMAISGDAQLLGRAHALALPGLRGHRVGELSSVWRALHGPRPQPEAAATQLDALVAAAQPLLADLPQPAALALAGAIARWSATRDFARAGGDEDRFAQLRVNHNHALGRSGLAHWAWSAPWGGPADEARLLAAGRALAVGLGNDLRAVHQQVVGRLQRPGPTLAEDALIARWIASKELNAFPLALQAQMLLIDKAPSHVIRTRAICRAQQLAERTARLRHGLGDRLTNWRARLLELCNRRRELLALLGEGELPPFRADKRAFHRRLAREAELAHDTQRRRAQRSGLPFPALPGDEQR